MLASRRIADSLPSRDATLPSSSSTPMVIAVAKTA